MPRIRSPDTIGMNSIILKSLLSGKKEYCVPNGTQT